VELAAPLAAALKKPPLLHFYSLFRRAEASYPGGSRPSNAAELDATGKGKSREGVAYAAGASSPPFKESLFPYVPTAAKATAATAHCLRRSLFSPFSRQKKAAAGKSPLFFLFAVSACEKVAPHFRRRPWSCGRRRERARSANKG
jgi:hypothetical protein